MCVLILLLSVLCCVSCVCSNLLIGVIMFVFAKKYAIFKCSYIIGFMALASSRYYGIRVDSYWSGSKWIEVDSLRYPGHFFLLCFLKIAIEIGMWMWICFVVVKAIELIDQIGLFQHHFPSNLLQAVNYKL